jgi:parallel beta-helix repeat protein
MAKQLLTIVSIFLFLRAGAVNYYLSAHGRDDNSGRSPDLAWQGISKLNSVKLSAGDSVFFKRGDIFYGFLIIHNSGTVSNPIFYGAYGAGLNPVVTGFKTVESWTSLGNHILESTTAVSSLSLANVVSVNGFHTAMGRYPNAGTGYLQLQTHTNNSISSNSLTGSPNWTGADLVIRFEKWIIGRDSIISQSAGTLSYTAGTGLPYAGGLQYKAHDNWGFFIQNDIRTLDTLHEWFYNRNSRKIDIYETGNPPIVQVSTIDTLVNIQSQNDITFDNISFTGANSYAFWITGSKRIVIQHCKLDLNYNGVRGQNSGRGNSAGFVFNADSVLHTNNDAVDMASEFSADTITNNLIRNTGIYPGMGGSGDGQYQGINTTGSGTFVAYNEVDSTGYIGVGFRLGNINISYNYIHNYCFVKDDGGGIYTQGSASGNLVSYNTVINGLGALNGTANGFAGGNGLSAAYGIYLDDFSSGAVVSHNTTANNSYGGIFLHNANNIKVIDNTSYNNVKTGFGITNNKAGLAKRGGIVCERNIFFQKNADTQANSRNFCFTISTMYGDKDSLGSFDNNYFARPMDDNLVFDIDASAAGGKHNRYTLADWKTLSGYEQNSKKSPVTIVHTGDVRFEFNPGASPVTISLPNEYTDVTGRSYQGTISLPPFSSLILMKN